MNITKICARAFVVLAVVLTVSCTTGNVRQVDPNYMQTINAQNQAVLAKAQMVESLVRGCESTGKNDASAWCTSMIGAMLTGGGNGLNGNKVPTYVEKKSKSDIILSKSLDILGRALPIVGNVIINKDNNKANVKIQESRNAMLGDIVTSGFDSMTVLGNRDTVSVGGDYVVGDGNTTGDGNIFAGDDAVIGNDNLVGDGNTTGDGNLVGDGNTTGDGNQFAEGDGNVFGDDNLIGNDNRIGDGNTEGDGNVFGNDTTGDLFIGDSNGDVDNSDNSDNSNGGVGDGG